MCNRWQLFAKGAFSKKLPGVSVPNAPPPEKSHPRRGSPLPQAGCTLRPLHCSLGCPIPKHCRLWRLARGLPPPPPCMMLPGSPQPLPGYRALPLRKGAGKSPAALAGVSLRQLGKGSLRLLWWLLPMHRCYRCIAAAGAVGGSAAGAGLPLPVLAAGSDRMCPVLDLTGCVRSDVGHRIGTSVFPHRWYTFLWYTFLKVYKTVAIPCIWCYNWYA